jgi:hypothetical protein
MSLRRLEIAQWLGFLLGGVVWFAAHLAGFGISQARCSPAGAGWGVSNNTWQAVLTGVAGALVLAAEAAAVTVFLETRHASYESAPAVGRIRFLAIAAMAANGIFLVIVVLNGLGTIFGIACRGA